MAKTTTVYLLHLNTPIAHARHYLGSTADLAGRLAAHEAGTGARLMEVAKERGIGFELARTWAGGRTYERQLKRRHNGPRLCPICRAAVTSERAKAPAGGAVLYLHPASTINSDQTRYAA